MKLFVTFAVLLLATFATADDESCYDQIANVNLGQSSRCNAVYGGIDFSLKNLNTFFSTKLATSYDYLLLQTHFDSYQKNRPGFKKLFAGLSDEAWNESVEIIKYIAKRGGVVDFSNFNNKTQLLSTLSAKRLELEELHSLATVLDSEKVLAKEAIQVHQHASHLNHLSEDEQHKYDPDLTQFIEEKFLEKQADKIRKLSGYVNDLRKLSSVSDPSLNVYLFDQYLEKQ